MTPSWFIGVVFGLIVAHVSYWLVVRAIYRREWRACKVNAGEFMAGLRWAPWWLKRSTGGKSTSISDSSGWL